METLSITSVYRLYHWNFLLLWKLFINIRNWKKIWISIFVSLDNTTKHPFEFIYIFRTYFMLSQFKAQFNSVWYNALLFISRNFEWGVSAKKNQTKSTTSCGPQHSNLAKMTFESFLNIIIIRFILQDLIIWINHSIISAFMYRCILNCRK